MTLDLAFHYLCIAEWPVLERSALTVTVELSGVYDLAKKVGRNKITGRLKFAQFVLVRLVAEFGRRGS